MAFVAIEEALRALIEHFAGMTVPGWTSLMVVVCLNNAVLLGALGIIGEYVGRSYEEGKARPLYVIADTWNITPHGDAPRTTAPRHRSAPDERASLLLG